MNIVGMIKDLSRDFGLQYFLYNEIYPDSGMPYAVKLQLSIDGLSYSTWGVSENKDLAFFKALMELIERISADRFCSIIYEKSFFKRSIAIESICQRFNVTTSHLFPNNTNGVAINLSKSAAKSGAFLELLERHTVLTALFLDIPPFKIKTSELFLGSIKFSLEFFYWQVSKFYIVVAVAFTDTGNFLFSHSCRISLDDAIERAYHELIPNLLFFSGKDLSLKEVKIVRDDISSFRDYWLYSGDNRAHAFLNSFSSEISNKYQKIPVLKDVYYSELPIPSYFKNFVPDLRCIRAISPQAQQLFFDSWNRNDVHPALLGLSNLPDFPHFIA